MTLSATALPAAATSDACSGSGHAWAWGDEGNGISAPWGTVSWHQKELSWTVEDGYRVEVSVRSGSAWTVLSLAGPTSGSHRFDQGINDVGAHGTLLEAGSGDSEEETGEETTSGEETSTEETTSGDERTSGGESTSGEEETSTEDQTTSGGETSGGKSTSGDVASVAPSGDGAPAGPQSQVPPAALLGSTPNGDPAATEEEAARRPTGLVPTPDPAASTWMSGTPPPVGSSIAR